MANGFTTAANDLKKAMDLNYARQKQVDAAIQKKNEDMKKTSDETAKNYEKDTSENKQEKMAKARAVAYALEYSQMSDKDKKENLETFEKYCSDAGYGWMEEDGMGDAESLLDQIYKDSKDNQPDEQS